MVQLQTHLKRLRPSATLAINEQSAALMRQGKKVYRLGFGQSPFPVPAELVASLQQHAAIKDYLPVQGLLALRETVARFNQRTIQLDCTADEVMIGPGSKELIFNLQMALDADLLLPSPSWVSYEPQALLARKKVYWLPTYQEDEWRLKPSELQAFCVKNNQRPKILILNYPNNPVGNTYSAAQLEDIAKVARQHELIVVADEIYGALTYQEQHVSIAQYYPEGTIISSGLSKWCGAGGWRLGTFTFPTALSEVKKIMCTIASETYTSVSAPIQYAAVTAFQGSPLIERYVIQSRTILNTIAQYVYEQLSSMDIEMPRPQGGFYLFPNFEKYRLKLGQKGVSNSPDLCTLLLEETGIALLPGVAFGRPSRELTARLSFVDFDGEKLLNIVEENPYHHLHNNTFLEQHCPRIVEAMRVLKNWLDS